MKIEKTINLFIVEDNVPYASALKQYLLTWFERTQQEISIQTFHTSESCLEWLDFYNSIKPDFIILDYFLNSQFKDSRNGLNALFEIKLAVPGAEVIFLSSQDKIEVAVSALKLGAFDYIVKNNQAFKNVFGSIQKCILMMENEGKILPQVRQKTVSF